MKLKVICVVAFILVAMSVALAQSTSSATTSATTTELLKQLAEAKAEVEALRQYIVVEAAWREKQTAILNAAINTCLGSQPQPPAPAQK